MEVDGDGFQLVSGRRCRHRCRSKQKTTTRAVQDHHDSVDHLPSALHRLVDSVDRCRLELDSSAFKRDFEVAALKAGILKVRGDGKYDIDDEKNCQLEVKTIVSYGIGNFSACPIARYQISFLAILRELLKVKEGDCYLFDPVFTNLEKEGVLRWGYQLINTNEEGKRLSKGVTLFYMPHCSKALYNNLLWTNWDPSHLKNTMVIGNSFNRISESIPERKFKNDFLYIFKAINIMQEIPLPNTFQHKDVFNNTSFHTFRADGAKPLPTELNDPLFWVKTEEPKYDDDDKEIITVSNNSHNSGLNDVNQ